LPCPEPCLNYTFEDIIDGKLTSQFDAIICSFALHLVEPSRLPDLLYTLSNISPILYVISPHKNPVIDHFRWNLVDKKVHQRVHFRYYSTESLIPDVPNLSKFSFFQEQPSFC